MGGASSSISCFSRESQAPGRRVLKLCHSDQDVLIVEVVMGVEGVEVKVEEVEGKVGGRMW